MGLDWCLKSTENGKSPLEYIGAERCDLSNPKHVEIAKAIIKSHRDNISDSDNLNYKDHWNQPEAVLLADFAGKVLVDTIDLSKFKEQLPALGNPFSALSGIEAFRGKRVGYCELLPEPLRNEAYEEMDPGQMLDYAGRLEQHLPTELGFDYEATKKKADKYYAEKGMFADTPPDVPEGFWDICTIKEAAAWLRFWAQFPVKMVPWY